MIEVHNFISVIIPCLNNERTIERCIKSLINQDYPKKFFEMILIDNGSSDMTISIIQQYPVNILIEPIKNPYIARNLGALHAKGQILAFSDANCEFTSNWLSSINHTINTSADVSQGPGYLTNQNNLLPKAESIRLFMDHNCFWGDAKNLAIKKTLFYKVNGFFEYHTGCDSLLVDQLKSQKYNVKYNNNQQVYRDFSEQLTTLLNKSWKYGKADIVVDFFRNDLKRFRMLRKITLSLPKRLFKKLINSRSTEDIFISIYYFFTLEIRYISYFFNFNSVLNEINSVKPVYRNLFHK